jgi:hypothetical protein
VNVRSVILTKTSILPEFQRHADKFTQLWIVIIDAPFQFPHRLKERPEKRYEQKKFAEFVQQGKDFRIKVRPYIQPGRWELCLTLHVEYGMDTEEVSKSVLCGPALTMPDHAGQLPARGAQTQLLSGAQERHRPYPGSAINGRCGGRSLGRG